MGLKFEGMEKSNSSFFHGGGACTTACLKAVRTQPDISEELITSTIHGPKRTKEKMPHSRNPFFENEKNFVKRCQSGYNTSTITRIYKRGKSAEKKVRHVAVV